MFNYKVIHYTNPYNPSLFSAFFIKHYGEPETVVYGIEQNDLGEFGWTAFTLHDPNDIDPEDPDKFFGIEEYWNEGCSCGWFATVEEAIEDLGEDGKFILGLLPSADKENWHRAELEDRVFTIANRRSTPTEEDAEDVRRFAENVGISLEDYASEHVKKLSNAKTWADVINDKRLQIMESIN